MKYMQVSWAEKNSPVLYTHLSFQKKNAWRKQTCFPSTWIKIARHTASFPSFFLLYIFTLPRANKELLLHFVPPPLFSPAAVPNSHHRKRTLSLIPLKNEISLALLSHPPFFERRRRRTNIPLLDGEGKKGFEDLFPTSLPFSHLKSMSALTYISCSPLPTLHLSSEDVSLGKTGVFVFFWGEESFGKIF